MARGCSTANKGLFSAAVCTNRQIEQRYYRLRLEFSGPGAEAFGNCQPGQFAELDLADVRLPSEDAIPEDLADVAGRKILLRRPFSFADVTAEKNKTFVDILYRVVGPASLRMTTLSAGDSVSIIGPLGNGFLVPNDKKSALLVAGGMGVGPLQHLAKVLTADFPDIEVIAFVGAKTTNQLPCESRLDEISQRLGFSLAEFARYGVKSMVATDDGSIGYHGSVTECLSDWLHRNTLVDEDAIIYSCGPEAMLAQVAEIAKLRKIDCQVSMERRMACGIGICQSCAVECKVGESGETVYKLCCEDGPVFDSKEVIFNL
jgi:dihydroorotate dehydrogenase electron transfer subunit